MSDLSISAVITVGDGRFIITSQGKRVVVTAAHCLPHLPPYGRESALKKRTYANLLGLLGEKPIVWAECLFADPVAGIAILGSPNDSALPDQADAYKALVESVRPLKIGKATELGSGRLLSLEGKWFECNVQCDKRFDGPIWVSNAAQPLIGGMSGSPICSDDGKAIGVACLADGGLPTPNARLTCGRKRLLSFRWVRGHDQSIGNLLADKLSMEAIEEATKGQREANRKERNESGWYSVSDLKAMGWKEAQIKALGDPDKVVENPRNPKFAKMRLYRAERIIPR
jgi:hypothetical protein